MCDVDDPYDVDPYNSVDLQGKAWEHEESVPCGDATAMPADSVQGRLKGKIQFWREVLGAPEYIIGIIESGYVIPLISNPPPLYQPNQQSAVVNEEFVQQSVSELLAKQCIRQVESVPYICSPLSVMVSSSGKKRLVINFRHLNKFLLKKRFKT